MNRFCFKCKTEIPPGELAHYHRRSEYYDTWEHDDCVASLKAYLKTAEARAADADACNARLVQRVEALTVDLDNAHAILDLAEKAAAVRELREYRANMNSDPFNSDSTKAPFNQPPFETTTAVASSWYVAHICPRCGANHRHEECPQVKSIEYHDDGRTIKRVEYFENTGRQPVQHTVTISPPQPDLLKMLVDGSWLGEAVSQRQQR